MSPSKPVDLQPIPRPGMSQFSQGSPILENKATPVAPANGPSIFLATPTINGFRFNWVVSVLKLVDACLKRKISLSFGFMEGGSLIPHTRNDLMRQFLNGRWTHMLMTDDDIGFEADDVFKMLDTGHEFICGAVPLKAINHQFVEIHLKEGDFDAKKHLTKFNINTTDTNFEIRKDEDGSCDITFAGTAFILVSRKAVERIIANDEARPLVYSSGADATYDLFGLMFRKKEDGTLEALGEDVSFCERYKSAGGKIKLWPNMTLTHCGPFTFRGNFSESLGIK